MDEQITLSDWLKTNQCSQERLGARVGCDGVHIGRIVKGDPRVSQTLALKIFDETGVKVGPLKALTNPEVAVVRRVNAPETGTAA